MKHELFALAAALFTLAAPAAHAQTLTIEVDAAVEEAPAPVAGPAPVVVVRPETDARVAPPPPRPDYGQPVAVPRAPAPTPEDDPEIEAWGGLMIVVDGLDVANLELTLNDPEVEALDGLALGPEWAGRQAMGTTVTGGVGLHAGMRAAGFFRGPELRLMLGGGSVDTEFAPTAVPGMDAAVTSLFWMRAELALGLQVPIGPVTPYAVAIGSVGVALVDVDVRHQSLGGLGTETIEAALYGFGLEAGVDVELEDGVTLGFAFRGSFVGTPSLGGAFRVSFGGE